MIYAVKILRDNFNPSKTPESVWDDLEEQYPWLEQFRLPEPLGGPDPQSNLPDFITTTRKD